MALSFLFVDFLDVDFAVLDVLFSMSSRGAALECPLDADAPVAGARPPPRIHLGAAQGAFAPGKL